MVVEALQVAGAFTGILVVAFILIAVFAWGLALLFDGDGAERFGGLALLFALVFAITFVSVLGVNYAKLDKAAPPSDDAVRIVVPDIIDITVEGSGDSVGGSEAGPAERDDGLRLCD